MMWHVEKHLAFWFTKNSSTLYVQCVLWPKVHMVQKLLNYYILWLLCLARINVANGQHVSKKSEVSFSCIIIISITMLQLSNTISSIIQTIYLHVLCLGLVQREAGCKAPSFWIGVYVALFLIVIPSQQWFVIDMTSQGYGPVAGKIHHHVLACAD